MFSFFKKRQDNTSQPAAAEPADVPVTETAAEVEPAPAEAIPAAPAPEAAPAEPVKSGGFFSRLKQGLSRTRETLAEGLSSLIVGRKTIDAELLDEIEMQLLTA